MTRAITISIGRSVWFTLFQLTLSFLVYHSYLATSSILLIPQEYASLDSAFHAVASGDIIQISAGVYSGQQNCGLSLTVSNVTIQGSSTASSASSASPTIFNCNISTAPSLLIFAESAKLQLLTFIGSDNSLPNIGCGLMFTSASQLTVQDCVFNGGRVQNLPSSYSWRGYSGGAIQISASVSPVSLQFQRVTFLNNSVSCSEYSCIGGAISIQLSQKVASYNNVKQEEIVNNITFENCLFQRNNLYAIGLANGLQGAAIAFSNYGNASIVFKIVGSLFESNSMKNDVNPIVATGGSLTLMNINFQDLTVYSKNMSVYIWNSNFTGNKVYCYQCNSLSYTANGGAIAPFGPVLVDIFNSSFIANGVFCIADITSSASGIAEGGAIFVEGLYDGNPLYLQPILNITSSVFDSNIANCSGSGCLSLGGAVEVSVAAAVYFNDIIATSNVAYCTGSSCGSQGGFCQIQNGPQIDVGVVDLLLIEGTDVVCNANIATAVSSASYTTPCDTSAGAACDNPVYGGAVALLSWNGGVLFSVKDWKFESNSVHCGNVDCNVYAADVGSAATTLSNGLPATVTMSIMSSTFTCDNVTCSSGVTGCNALQQIWSTDYYTTKSESHLTIGGNGCAFIGDIPPIGIYVNISSSCDVSEATDTSVCFGGSSDVTASPSSVPTTSPTALPSAAPSFLPTVTPSVSPSFSPTAIPSAIVLSADPTTAPTTIPSTTLSTIPTTIPTTIPSTIPTAIPTTAPSDIPTIAPTEPINSNTSPSFTTTDVAIVAVISITCGLIATVALVKYIFFQTTSQINAPLVENDQL